MARTGAIVFSWRTPVRGREQQAFEVFGEALGFMEEQAKEGRVIGHREYFFSNGRGGMMVVDGLLPELHQLIQTDDFLRLVSKSGAIVDDFRYEIAAGGSDHTVQEVMEIFRGGQEELGLL